MNQPAGWARLDPRMLAVAPGQELVRFLPLLVVALLAGRGDGQPFWVLAVLVMAAGTGVLRWLTTRYRVDAERVEVHSGLVFRQHRSVPRDRVRTVDVTANPLQRLFGLAVLRVGTGRQQESRQQELALNAVRASEAERLRALLLDRSSRVEPAGSDLAPPATSAAGTSQAPWTAPGQAPSATTGQAPSATTGQAPSATTGQAPSATTGQTPSATTGQVPSVATGAPWSATGQAPAVRELARISWSWLRYAPLTLFGVVAVGALVGTTWQLLEQFGVSPTDADLARTLFEWLTGSPAWLTAVTIAAAVLAIGTLGAIVLYAEAWWRYRLTRHPDNTLQVNRGLLTRRSISLEERKLRGVTVDEPLLLRAGGGASCTAVATGSGGTGQAQLLPPAPRAEAHRVAAAVLREANPPTLASLRRHPRAALRRRLIRTVLPALALLAGLAIADIWLPSWPWQLAAILLVPAVLVARDRYRNLGHAETARQLVAREGSLVRQTVALQHQGIIGWKIEQSVFQRLAGIATITATTAAGSGAYRVLDVELPEGLNVADSATPGLLTPFLLR
jgi:putative membrane protein